MVKQLNIFDAVEPKQVNFAISLDNHYRSFKSMKENYQTRYMWITNSLFINSGLLIIEARYNLTDDQIQALLDLGKIKVAKIGQTYITWIAKYFSKKPLTKSQK